MASARLPVVPLTQFEFAVEWAGAPIAELDLAGILLLCEALIEYGVVVVPIQQPLRAAEVEAFAHRLGSVEVVFPAEHRLSGTHGLRLQSNVPGVGVSGGGMYWHADGSWKSTPTAATLLACVEAPTSSGRTSFVDAAALYASFEPSWASQVVAATGHYPNRRILERELKDMGIIDPAMLAETFDADHPLVRRHPLTDMPAIILNENWLGSITGLPKKESDAFLAELYESVNRSPYRYVHAWRLGDVILWDNNRAMHRAEPVDGTERKVTWRATITNLHRHDIPG